MRTNTFIKALAFAMLLATACNKNEIANDENTEKKGFALPVTVNVTRKGDDATKATYNETSKKLEFSAGDKLFVRGSHTDAGKFAGLLDYDSEKKNFSGTVTTKKEYTGTIDDLMASAAAFLLPDGYGSYGFFYFDGSGIEAMPNVDLTKAFALTKAAAVEQFSVEYTTLYSSGFALAPMNAIASFTISGLTANKEVAVSFVTSGTGTISGNVTTNATGVATFAVGVSPGQDLGSCTLTVDGNNIAMPTKTTVAGHIYNISRSAVPATDLSAINANYTASNGETLTGTLASNVQISIANGATVTLNGVSINADGYWKSGDYAGITCLGDATIILSGTNTVKGFYEDYPGIQAAVGKTLTIKGRGSLTASSNGYGAGIGGGFDIHCGNIEIQGGTITATGGVLAAGIGSGSNASCGDITITSGVTSVTATKGSSEPNSIGAGDGGTCGTVKFGNQTMYNGSSWTTTPTSGSTYGGLNLTISQTTFANDTWTLTPVLP